MRVESRCVHKLEPSHHSPKVPTWNALKVYVFVFQDLKLFGGPRITKIASSFVDACAKRLGLSSFPCSHEPAIFDPHLSWKWSWQFLDERFLVSVSQVLVILIAELWILSNRESGRNLEKKKKKSSMLMNKIVGSRNMISKAASIHWTWYTRQHHTQLQH